MKKTIVAILLAIVCLFAYSCSGTGNALLELNCDHNQVEAENVNGECWFVCKRCKKPIEPANHRYHKVVFNDEEHWSVCYVCSQVFNEGTHEMENWKYPLDKESGKYYGSRKCKDCDYKEICKHETTYYKKNEVTKYHDEFCSTCQKSINLNLSHAYTEYEYHTVTLHIAKCVCGESELKQHQYYWAKDESVGEGSSIRRHIQTCSCGYTTGERENCVFDGKWKMLGEGGMDGHYWMCTVCSARYDEGPHNFVQGPNSRYCEDCKFVDARNAFIVGYWRNVKNLSEYIELKANYTFSTNYEREEVITGTYTLMPDAIHFRYLDNGEERTFKVNFVMEGDVLRVGLDKTIFKNKE